MAEEIITSTNAETATDHEYNASEIQVLKGLEAVRKRPGMYIGSTGERGLHHLVYEIVDNAIDEALAGYCDHIEVKILKGDIIQVTDNGRGIPVDIQADTGLPAVTVVYTILKHCLHHTSGESPAHVLGTFVHIQNITYAVSGTALVINVHIPDRLSCQNVQIPSGTAVEPVGMGQLHHCRCYHGVMLFDLFGNGT